MGTEGSNPSVSADWKIVLSASVDPSSRTTQARFARVAVSVLFFTNGALYANLVPRFPEVKTQLGLGDALYGLSIALLPLGALLSGLAAGKIIRWIGSARLAAFGTIVLGAAMLLIGTASFAWMFALGLFIVGVLDSVIDVAQNAHGLRVQKLYGRSIINSFHAIWSLGAVVGGLMAVGAIALHLPLSWHLILTFALFSVLALIALKFCLPGADDPSVSTESTGTISESKTGLSKRTVFVVVALSFIAISGAVVEDVGSSWATLYLQTGLSAPATVAPLGFLALIGFQFLGRLVGDRMTDSLGQRTVARLGGGLVVAGMTMALAWPSIALTLIGLALAGFGAAKLVPAAMDSASRLPGFAHGTALAIVTWLMRIGSLMSPLLIGIVADSQGLRIGLIIVPVFGLFVLALSGVLRKKQDA